MLCEHTRLDMRVIPYEHTHFCKNKFAEETMVDSYIFCKAWIVILVFLSGIKYQKVADEWAFKNPNTKLIADFRNTLHCCCL